jgi:6-phosphogluconolactonase/glucosamine-6-phosphate isomerase/deaminase
MRVSQSWCDKIFTGRGSDGHVASVHPSSLFAAQLRLKDLGLKRKFKKVLRT